MMGFTPGSVSADNTFPAMLREICEEVNENRMLPVCMLTIGLEIVSTYQL